MATTVTAYLKTIYPDAKRNGGVHVPGNTPAIAMQEGTEVDAAVKRFLLSKHRPIARSTVDRKALLVVDAIRKIKETYLFDRVEVDVPCNDGRYKGTADVILDQSCIIEVKASRSTQREAAAVYQYHEMQNVAVGFCRTRLGMDKLQVGMYAAGRKNTSVYTGYVIRVYGRDNELGCDVHKVDQSYFVQGEMVNTSRHRHSTQNAQKLVYVPLQQPQNDGVDCSLFVFMLVVVVVIAAVIGLK
jgi:hypothetical protein